MEQIIKEISEYAAERGVSPATVLQNAIRASSLQWARWVDGSQSPTMRTVEAVRAYMTANPVARRIEGE